MPPPPADAALAAWGRVAIFADKLFQALDELEEVGGPGRVAALAHWSPAAMSRAIDSLCATREGLDAAVIRLEARRKFYPRREEGRRRRKIG